jgi:ketosteroid isomerase-like protein
MGATMRMSRWLVVLLAVGAIGPVSGSAQTLAATKRQIAALEEDWIAAVVRRDAAAFDRLLAPSFVYTEDDRVYTKAQLIKEVTTGSDTVTSGRNEDLTVRVYGNTAVATGWLVLIGRGASGRFERRYRYTDTWLRTGNRWRVIAAQDYLKP